MASETAAITSLLFGTKKTLETAKSNIKQDTVSLGFAVASIWGHAYNTVTRLDKTVAKGNISSITNKLADKTSPEAIETAGKIGKYFGNAINGLIICNAGYNVYKDEDKPKALVEQGLKVGGMFAAENIYKAFNVTKKIEESALPGKLKHIAAAAGFVAVSAGAAFGGEYLGKAITGRDGEAKTPEESLVTA